MIIFSELLIFYHSNKHGMYKFLNEFPNDLVRYFKRKLEFVANILSVVVVSYSVLAGVFHIFGKGAEKTGYRSM